MPPGRRGLRRRHDPGRAMDRPCRRPASNGADRHRQSARIRHRPGLQGLRRCGRRIPCPVFGAAGRGDRRRHAGRRTGNDPGLHQRQPRPRGHGDQRGRQHRAGTGPAGCTVPVSRCRPCPRDAGRTGGPGVQRIVEGQGGQQHRLGGERAAPRDPATASPQAGGSARPAYPGAAISGHDRTPSSPWAPIPNPCRSRSFSMPCAPDGSMPRRIRWPRLSRPIFSRCRNTSA